MKDRSGVAPGSISTRWRSATRLGRLSRGLLFVLGGALAGFLYQHFVGCRTGSCPITSNPVSATLFGALIGYLALGGRGAPKKE